MAGYQLTIKNTEETIKLSTKDTNGSEITQVLFKMNSLENDVKNRSDSIRGELEIKGDITTDNKDNTKLLAKWSLDTNKATLYRDVELIVYQEKNCTGQVLRRYKIEGMFVIDYEERFGTKSDAGEYTLFIAQKEYSVKKEIFST